ncbi:MAG: hypothetical protein PUC36_08595 [Clostridiales bacterium]|nr:hypothetical protein [Clostridiales bacterium]
MKRPAPRNGVRKTAADKEEPHLLQMKQLWFFFACQDCFSTHIRSLFSPSNRQLYRDSVAVSGFIQ